MQISTDTRYHALALVDSLRWDVVRSFRYTPVRNLSNLLDAYRQHLTSTAKDNWVFWAVLDQGGSSDYGWTRNPEF
jgi:hypothetical protein